MTNLTRSLPWIILLCFKSYLLKLLQAAQTQLSLENACRKEFIGFKADGQITWLKGYGKPFEVLFPQERLLLRAVSYLTTPGGSGGKKIGKSGDDYLQNF